MALRGHTITIESPARALPAGWYTDPAQSGGKRWWDGAKWTNHLRMPEAAKPVAAASESSPYAASAHQPAYTPLSGNTTFGPTATEPTYALSNRSAWLSLAFGILAAGFTVATFLPGPDSWWVAGAGIVALAFGSHAIALRTRDRSTNLWAPIVGMALGTGLAAAAIAGISVLGLLNSLTGASIPTTTVTHSVVAQTSPEPFVFVSNQVLTDSGTTVQQIATTLNRTYAAGNAKLSTGETWPASLKFSGGQIIAPSGTPLLSVAPDYVSSYKLSADGMSYTLTVSSGNLSEVAIYYSATDRFSFTCAPADTNCVPAH